MSDVVKFELLNCSNGKKIGIATLNSESTLNALNHEMVSMLFPQLLAWQSNGEVVAVFLQGAGSKAFCAGGDVVYLYNNLPISNEPKSSIIETFFTDEYELDHLIHTYKKPIAVWGNGIVMGGGLGLMVGGSHRIVTETTRIAMPEISIGLYPDVGGTYFLNQMPDNCGLFLGLTGASINAADALYTNIADHFVSNSDKAQLMMSLIMADWQDDSISNHQHLTSILNELETNSQSLKPESNVQAHQTYISDVTKHGSLEEIVADIRSTKTDDKWLIKAQKSLMRGSAISAHITYRQLRLGKSLSLADCFRLELGLSTKCGEFGEFKEGVRALLIEKDNAPAWKYANVAEVAPDDIDWFFSSPWTEKLHPLAMLGK